MDIKEVAAKYGDYQIEMRRHFHTNPEVSGKEFNTSDLVKKELDKIGVSWRKCGLETGVLAIIKGAKPGKTILIRGDMKELPMMMGSEDFAYYSKVPSVFGFLGSRDEKAGLTASNHNDHYTVPESVLKRGTAFYAQFAADYLAKNCG